MIQRIRREGQKAWKENERKRENKRALKIIYCIPEQKH